MSFQAEKRLENFFDGPCRFCLHVRHFVTTGLSMQKAQKSTLPRSTGVTPPDDLRDELRALVSSIGEQPTLDRLSISRPTFGRVMAGLPVRVGTLAHIREQLQTNASKGANHVA